MGHPYDEPARKRTEAEGGLSDVITKSRRAKKLLAMKKANREISAMNRACWMGDPSIEAPPAEVPERKPVAFTEPPKPFHKRTKGDDE